MAMFCDNCHGLLRTKKVKGRLRKFCPKCGDEDGRLEIESPIGDGGVAIDPDGGIGAAKPAMASGSREQGHAMATKEPSDHLKYFPHEEIRDGQREFLTDVAQAFEGGKHLIAYAPTGLGKTVAALVPAINLAMRTKRKVFFLTSKQSQHHIAVETVKAIRERSGMDIGVTDIIAKQDMCPRDIAKEHPLVFNEFCKLEQKTGTCKYFSKHDSQLKEEVVDRALHVEELMEMATKGGVCPHRLALEAAALTEVVICDYNYVFSDMSSTMLNAMDLSLDDLILIIDEAHNLPDRIRAHLSRDLTLSRLDDAIAETKSSDQRICYFLKHMKGMVAKMLESAPKGQEALVERAGLIGGIEGILKQTVDAGLTLDMFIDDLVAIGERIMADGKMFSATLEVGAFLDGFRQEHEGMMRAISDVDTPRIYYRLLDPSAISAPVFEEVHASVLMSGTLFPPKMYADMLGIETERAVLRQYESPFPKENRPVVVSTGVTTLYKKRDEGMFSTIASRIMTASCEVPGNIAVFFPSYQIMNDVRYHIERANPAKKLIVEERGASKREKDEMVKDLKRTKVFRGGLLLGVMGGSLSEGIDYKDNLLDSVMIVGLPLAPPSLELKQLTGYYDKKFGYGKGEEYGYISPAMNKVLQAMGRCIRSETDRAMVVLLDDRFVEFKYRKFLPQDLQMQTTKELDRELRSFYDPRRAGT